MRGLLFAVCLALWATPAAAGNDSDAIWGALRIESDVDLRALGWDGDLGLRGRPVSEAGLDRAVTTLLAVLAEAGYPFAEVRPGSFDREDDRITGVLRVDPGTPAHVEALILEGAEVTRTGTIYRVAGIKVGQRFTGKETGQVEERLRRSGLFTMVNDIQVLPGTEEGGVVLRARVTEPSYTRFAGIVGLGKGGEVTGLLDLQLKNLAGTAREGAVTWQNQGAGLTRFHLSYREPWLPVIPVGLAGLLKHDVNSGVYSYTQYELTGDLTVAFRWTFVLGLGGASAVETADTGVKSDESYFLAGATYDSRTSVWNPLGGAYLTLQSRRGDKKVRPADGAGPEVRFDRTRWTVAGEMYQRAGARWLGSARTRFNYLDTPEEIIPRYDLYAVGGALSVRGYREEQFITNLAWTFQTEWRLMQDAKGSAVYALLDGGLISDRKENGSYTGRFDSFLLGYGVGVRQVTRLGVLGVEYGIPRGTGVLDGRIHLRVAAAF